MGEKDHISKRRGIRGKEHGCVFVNRRRLLGGKFLDGLSNKVLFSQPLSVMWLVYGWFEGKGAKKRKKKKRKPEQLQNHLPCHIATPFGTAHSHENDPSLTSK